MDLIRLREDPSDGMVQWWSAEYQLTPAGEALLQDYPCPSGPIIITPGFRQRLSEIFAEHGVGWEVPCPYEIVPWNLPWLQDEGNKS